LLITRLLKVLWQEAVQSLVCICDGTRELVGKLGPL